MNVTPEQEDIKEELTEKVVHSHCKRLKVDFSDKAQKEAVAIYDYICVELIKGAKEVSKRFGSDHIEVSHIDASKAMLLNPIPKPSKGTLIFSDIALFAGGIILGGEYNTFKEYLKSEIIKVEDFYLLLIGIALLFLSIYLKYPKK